MQGYLKFMEKEEELYEVDMPEKPLDNWIKKIAYFLTYAYLNFVAKLKKCFSIITVKEIYSGLIFILPVKVSEKRKVKKYIPKIKKLMKKYKILQIVIAEEIRNNEEFSQEFKEKLNIGEKIHILDGKELMPYLIEDIVEYIAQKQGETAKLEDLYLLIKKEDYRYKENILFLAQHFKNINIVTTSLKIYQKLAKQLEEKQDIIITVTNNKKKSLKRAKWIINFDLTSEELKKYSINRTATIIYLGKQGIYEENSFDGLHICKAGIDVSQEIKDYFQEQNLLNQCPITTLYESTINKEQSLKKVREQFKKDKVKVQQLYGRRGILTEQEYEKIKKLRCS